MPLNIALSGRHHLFARRGVRSNQQEIIRWKTHFSWESFSRKLCVDLRSLVHHAEKHKYRFAWVARCLD